MGRLEPRAVVCLNSQALGQQPLLFMEAVMLLTTAWGLRVEGA